MKRPISRRSFVLSSGASGLLIVKPATAFGSQANSAIEVGIIGCGARGVYIGDFFSSIPARGSWRSRTRCRTGSSPSRPT